MPRNTRPKTLHKILLPLAFVAFWAAGCRDDAAAHKQTAGASSSASSSGASSAAPVSSDLAGNPVYEDPGRRGQISLGGGDNHLALPTVPGSHSRIAALAWKTPVHKRPDPKSFVLGYLRAGAIVSASDEAVGYKGCKKGWRRIAPFGFVCLRKGNATTDLNNELVRALSRRPDISASLPYMYGIVRRPGPIYLRLPTREEILRAEKGLEKRMKAWFDLEGPNGAAFRADLWLRWQKVDQLPDPKQLWESKTTEHVPWYLADGRYPPGNLHGFRKTKDQLIATRMRHHNGFGFVDTAVYQGRRYAISTRLLVMPVDRLRPIKGSSFHGYEIPKDIDFPFALVRARKAYAYRLKGKKLVRAVRLKRRAAIKLTGKQRYFHKILHFQTVDGYWLSDRQVSRLDPAKRMPKWGKNGERWIDVSINRQTLVAYDGTRAVFATLVSTGEAGVGDPEKTKSTRRGIFRIDRKFLTATMDSNVVGEEFELRDIPYVQYFEGGYALHAAYWHDDFGIPRSHGCINLSPEDARRLFFWTEPKLPPGWHGVRRPLTGTIIFVHP